MGLWSLCRVAGREMAGESSCTLGPSEGLRRYVCAGAHARLRESETPGWTRGPGTCGFKAPQMLRVAMELRTGVAH